MLNMEEHEFPVDSIVLEGQKAHSAGVTFNPYRMGSLKAKLWKKGWDAASEESFNDRQYTMEF